MRAVMGQVRRAVSRRVADTRDLLRALGCDLDRPPADFAELADRVRRVAFRHRLAGVAGWLSRDERRALYALARARQGAILEVGAWVGLSTACLAYGIRDSGRRDSLVTTEINPGPENFRAWREGIGFFLPRHAEVPCGVSSVELFERDIRPVVSAPGGVIGTLRANLARLGLVDLVTIVEGDFRAAPRLNYGLVFSDTLHDEHEIETNAPGLRGYLRPGTLLACHDTTPANEVCLRRQLPLGRSFMVDSLLVAEVVA